MARLLPVALAAVASLCLLLAPGADAGDEVAFGSCSTGSPDCDSFCRSKNHVGGYCAGYPESRCWCKTTWKVLTLGGESPDPPQNISALFEDFPVNRAINEEFAMAEYAEIGPKGLLYVQQRELAAAHPSDENVEIIGSDDATTCIVAVLRHSGSGAAALGHFDGTDGVGGARAMVAKVTRLSAGAAGRLELSLVGGVLDDGHAADGVYADLINGFHGQNLEIDLVLAFIGEFNTFEGTKKRPLFYGAGIRLATGDVFPATFSDKGPDQDLRAAMAILGEEMLDVYDDQLGAIKIGPFNYEPLGDAEDCLQMDDRDLLHSLSTTPDMEPPRFIPQLRAALQFQVENPKPMETVFENNKPHYFIRDVNGVWSPIQALKK